MVYESAGGSWFLALYQPPLCVQYCVTTGPAGGRVYNFTLIDQSWDYQVRVLGLKPVVELSFMPTALAQCTWQHDAASNSTCKGWCGEHGYCEKPVKHYQGVTMVPAGQYPLLRRMTSVGAPRIISWGKTACCRPKTPTAVVTSLTRSFLPRSDEVVVVTFA